MGNHPLSAKALTDEKSLWHVYWQARRIGDSFGTWIIVFLGFGVLLTYSFMSTENSSGTLVKIDQFAKRLESVVDFGFGYVVSILGFLLAGFTIFATITDKSLFVSMARVKKDGQQYSYLKYVFFVFLWVFIQYFCFAFYSLWFKIFGVYDNPFFSFLATISADPNLSKRILLITLFTFSGAWLIYLVWILQSFIFNIYTTLMTTIRWHYEAQPHGGEPPPEHDDAAVSTK